MGLYSEDVLNGSTIVFSRESICYGTKTDEGREGQRGERGKGRKVGGERTHTPSMQAYIPRREEAGDVRSV